MVEPTMDISSWLRKQLEQVSPDLLREWPVAGGPAGAKRRPWPNSTRTYSPSSPTLIFPGDADERSTSLATISAMTSQADQPARSQVGVPDPDILRLRLVFWLVIVGIVAVFGAFAVGLREMNDKNGDTVVALVGAVTTAVGTLVGFVAGQKLGAAGKGKG